MMKRMACALALAAGTGLTLGVATRTALAQPTTATAVSGLKLSVAPLGALNADTPVALDVNFRGGKVRGVEVFLDGNRIAKETINTVDTHGVISFKLPSSLLPEGAHEIMIQATDIDGSTATTTTRLRINAPAEEAVARFLTPKRNAMVKEFAPIEIKLDDSIKDPYVVFFLDGAFLSARNYSPYVYSLDTSKYTNGSHTVKVEVWDSAGTSVLKTLTTALKINNVGGPTNLQTTTPDLNRKTPKPTTAEADVVRADAQASVPTGTLEMQSGSSFSHSSTNARNSMTVRNNTLPGSSFSPVKSKFPISGVSNAGMVDLELKPLVSNNDLARTPNANSSILRGTTAPKALLGNGDNHRPVRVTPQPSVNSTFPGLLAEPADLTALDGEMVRVARQAIKVRRSGNVAARPSTALDAVTTPVVASPAHTIKIAQTPRAYVGTRSMHNSHVKTFDVAFDNTQIAFDVPPRIENGMPLAPFRAIFEHSGGTVKWYSESKTVRAINNSKEIEIHIGDKEATVNNQKVKLDAKAYLDRGRTIVPLSFVKDAMDVKVTYDAHSGHVLIESNK